MLANGDFRVCCNATLSESRGMLVGEDGARVLNISDASFSEARNSALLREIRCAMLSGQWHPVCRRCKIEEAAGLKSGRLSAIEATRSFAEIWKDPRATQNDGGIDCARIPLKDMDVKLGNRCNLKCRMCGPADSDQWYSDWLNLYGPSDQATSAPRDWTQDPGSWSKIIQDVRLGHVEQFNFMGGEPLLNRNHFAFLSELVDAGLSRQVKLRYTTNLTVLPALARSLWPQFRRVKVNVSLDGVNEVNDYIRFPSRFAQVVANLRRLDQMPSPVHISISTTVSVLNVFYLTDLLRWKLEQGFSRVNCEAHEPLLNIHLLHQPDYLSVQILSASAKSAVQKRFADFQKWLAKWSRSAELSAAAERLLTSVTRYMQAADLSARQTHFLEITAKLDKLRGQDARLALPELFSTLNPSSPSSSDLGHTSS